MGLFLNEKVIVELNGYLVVEITVPENGYKTYSTARGTSEKYVFIYRAGEKTSFTDLRECEAYFSGLVTNEFIERETKAGRQVTDGVLSLMQLVKKTFANISPQ